MFGYIKKAVIFTSGLAGAIIQFPFSSSNGVFKEKKSLDFVSLKTEVCSVSFYSFFKHISNALKYVLTLSFSGILASLNSLLSNKVTFF